MLLFKTKISNIFHIITEYYKNKGIYLWNFYSIGKLRLHNLKSHSLRFTNTLMFILTIVVSITIEWDKLLEFVQ